MVNLVSEDLYIFPLSFAQERLWFLDQLEPGNTSYNISSALQLEGQLNIAALESAIQEIQQRHEVLRTTFQVIDGVPCQVIASSAPLSLSVLDLKGMASEAQWGKVQQHISEEPSKPFNLSSDSLLRVSLLQLADSSHVLQITVHHIVADVWSVGIFIRELSTLYQAFCRGESSPLAELPIQYADFAEWQRQWLRGDVLESQLNYWKQQLAGAPPLLELPTDRPRPPVQTFQGNRHRSQFSADLTQKIRRLSQQAGTTLFMTLLAAFALLLSRYSHQPDILVGSSIANRNRKEIEPLIGFFVNTLVLRINLQGNPTFWELLQRVRQMALEAYDHQDLPFEQLVEALQPDRSLSHNPLFQVMFEMQNAPVGTLELSELTLTPLTPEHTIAKFDLMLTMGEGESGLFGTWEYNSDLFEADTIRRMSEHFQTMVAAIVDAPDCPVLRIPLLTDGEREQLLVEWNNTQNDYPQAQCIHQLFEKQVEQTPEAIAVVCEGKQVTYAELNSRANGLARRLVEYGVRSETLVALFADRSIEFLTGMIAIFKAGGAYLPLDPQYPQQRISEVLQQSQAPFVLVSQPLESILDQALDRIGSQAQPKLLHLEQLWEQQSAENLTIDCQPNHLAYVIYTSGSTGVPKGAMVEHRGMVNHLYAKIKDLQLTHRDRIAQNARQSFDISVWQFLVALLVGGRVYIITDEVAAQSSQLLSQVQQQQITLLEIVPSLLRMVIEDLKGAHHQRFDLSTLRWLILTGEALPPQLCRQWFDYYPTIPMVNAYGPTECSDDVTHHFIFQPPTTEVLNMPIGRPVANTRLYVLDAQLQPLPIGVTGELYVGGHGVGRGYLNNPQRTAEVFICDPFAQEPGLRLYRTGDRVRYLPDGTIEFLGRIDHQVKIRGFRIELGEIETVLTQCPQVKETAVLVWEDADQHKRLVAYVVHQGEQPTISTLQGFLRQKLPESMIPAAFVFLEALPLTPNGKLDRRALPEPTLDLASQLAWTPPRTQKEEIIANVFASVLKQPQVGIHHNFFELGGHSLLATQVVSRLRQIFQREIPLRTLFEAPTVAELDTALSASETTNGGKVLPEITAIPNPEHPLPLSWAQERLWFLQQLEGITPTYNICSALKITGPLERVALEQAMSELIERHQVLRTTLPSTKGIPRVELLPLCDFSIPRVDGRSWSKSQQSQRIKDFAIQQAQQGFDLSSEPLMRVKLLQLEEQSYILLLSWHHIIFDAWSKEIFVRELIALYQSHITQESPGLPPLPIQYTDFAYWQRQWQKAEIIEAQLNYWQQKLPGPLPQLPLGTNPPVSGTPNHQGAKETIRLSCQLTASLKQLSQSQGVTLFMTLLASFKVLLSRHTGEEDIIIGCPIAGRHHLGTENLIGFFINTLPLRSDLSGNPSFVSLLQQVRGLTLEAYQNQDIPFEKIVEHLRPERSLSRHPIFDVTFNLLNTPAAQLEVPGLTFEPLTWSETDAKFGLSALVQEIEAQLTITLVYRRELFTKEEIENLKTQYEYLLQQIIEQPDKSIHSYSLVTPATQSQLPDPRIELEVPPYAPVTTQIAHWVAQTPQQVAITHQGERVSYAQLGQRAFQIAQVILAEGVQPGDVVALCGQPSVGLIAAMVGVFLSGGVLLIIDSTLPEARMQVMVNESAAKYLVNVGADSTPKPIRQGDGQLIHIEPKTGEPSQSPSQVVPLPQLTPEAPAYIFFTSGSTGKPKGVLGTHRGLAHFLSWQGQTFEITPQDRVAQLIRLSFDALLRDVFLPLTHGARLCLPDPERNLEPSQILPWLEGEKITLIHTVPTVVQYWLTQKPQGIGLESLRWLLLSGEPLTQTVVQQWRESFPASGQMVNLYGTTEMTMVQCYYPVPVQPPLGVMPGGWSLPHSQALILNPANQLCGIGEIGEIVIRSGWGTLGYINEPEAQQQRFRTNPYGDDPQVVCYYTGDLGRYRADGSVQVLGRQDEQLKIRGIQVQPGEIEAVLNQHPKVAASVVTVWEASPGDKRLVAYVVAQENQPLDWSELRGFVQQQLPDYLLPSGWVALEALPISANGKVNRRALPDPSDSLGQRTAQVAPRTPTEAVMVKLFAQLLGVEAVGVEENFFDIGGHSLLATQLVSRLIEAFDLELPLRTLFSSPTPAALAQEIETRRQTEAGQVIPPIEPASRTTEFLPLSWAQERLWFLNQLEGASATYNIAVAVHIAGTLDILALEQAYQELVQRHEILRTTFPLVKGVPVQVITPRTETAIAIVDLCGLESTEQTTEVQRQVKSHSEQPFNLAKGPLLSLVLLKLGQDSQVLVVTMHHIISDDWSMNLLIQELSTLYQAFASQQPSGLPELSIQYADFALWQRQWLQGEILKQQLGYWTQQLAGIPTLLNLPTDRPRPPVQTFRGSTQRFKLNRDLTQQLKHLSQQSGTTLFMTLLAAFALLLSRYSRQNDIVIGSPIANRNRQEIEPLIGLFINTLVLRVDLENNPTFSELLERVQQMSLDAYAHQDLPFEQLVEALQPQRSLSHHPLFQVMFVLHNAPTPTLELPELTLTPLERERTVAKFDLTLSMSETDTGLIGIWEYNSDLFEADTIARLVGHFPRLLTAIVAHPQQTVGQFPLLSEAERHQLLVEWNQTQAEYPQDKCIHHLFEEQVERTPDAVAVVFEGQELTYRELNSRANQLAHYLQTLGVKPEVLVGIYIERSVDMVVGLFGILKAGGAYVPLDPTYPPERIASMLDDSQLPVLVTQGKLRDLLPETVGHVLCLDTDWTVISQSRDVNPVSGVNASNLAYVIYTSGSTGKPKGTMLIHRAVVNYLSWCTQTYAVASGSGAPVQSSISFDATITSLFSPLLVGQRVVLLSEAQEIEALGAVLASQSNFSLVKLTPAHLDILAQLLPAQELSKSTQAFVIGGEALLSKSLEFWQIHAPQTRLINEYGPTETVVGCCVYEVTDAAFHPDMIPIGRPIANTQLYILDQFLQPLPIGVPGELYIGGAGVARGYLNRAELTAKRFIPNPFGEGRLYQTGDLARYLPDGTIEFLGRIDHQVKIRGFRIELAEIEAVLSQHPSVQDVVVLAREEEPGDKRLVAYVVPGEVTPTTHDLRGFLKEKLPDYMIPSAFVWLDSLPLTSNGKVDRRALPTPKAISRDLESQVVAPRTPNEAVLAQIWTDVLGVQQVSIHDNFFELGGDSILTIKIIARANQAGLQLTLRQFFEHQTIAELAALASPTPHSMAEQGIVTGSIPLTPIQHWFFERHQVNPHHWNWSFLCGLSQRLDISRLEETLNYLLRHHDALRLRFDHSEAGWQQRNAPMDVSVPLTVIDLSALTVQAQREAIESAAVELQSSLNLIDGPLFRVAYFNCGGQQADRLLMIFHHFLIDVVSQSILLADFQTVYSQLERGETAKLPPKTTSFQAWSKKLWQYAQSPELHQGTTYWLETIKPDLSPLPVDYPDGVNTEASTDQVILWLSQWETTALLEQFPVVYDLKIQEVLLTALVLSFSQWTGERSLLVELEGHGREDLFPDVDLSRTVGWFTSLFPTRLELENPGEPEAALLSIKNQLRRIPDRGIGFGLLYHLCPDKRISQQIRELPQAQVNFNYHGQLDRGSPSTLFTSVPENKGPERDLNGIRMCPLYIAANVTRGRLRMRWSYSTNLYQQKTIATLAQGFVENLQLLIAHCLSSGEN